MLLPAAELSSESLTVSPKSVLSDKVTAYPIIDQKDEIIYVDSAMENRDLISKNKSTRQYLIYLKALGEQLKNIPTS